MELSKSAREIVVQAQMLMLSTGETGLCVEHLFYGVLLLADYLDPPMDKPEFREDGKKVRAWLEEGGMQSVAAARKQLKTDAEDGGSNFEDASAVLGRAAEIADGGEISAMDLARAVMETSTPTILALRGLRNPALAAADARYGGKLPVLEPDMVRDPSHPDEETGRDAGGRADAGPAASGGRAGAAGGAGNGGQNGEREGLTPSQLGALLAFMALAQSQQTDGLRQNMNQGAGQGGPAGGKKSPKVVRRTKMGPFTYRGGTVAAAIQYFLFGIIVPFVGLIALNFVIAKVTGGRSESATGLPMYLIYLYISLWLFYLARGVALLFGIYSSALGNFLDILCDFGLIALNVRAVKLAWAMQPRRSGSARSAVSLPFWCSTAASSCLTTSATKATSPKPASICRIKRALQVRSTSSHLRRPAGFLCWSLLFSGSRGGRRLPSLYIFCGFWAFSGCGSMCSTPGSVCACAVRRGITADWASGSSSMPRMYGLQLQISFCFYTGIFTGSP